MQSAWYFTSCHLFKLSSRLDCVYYWCVTKTASPVCWEKDALVLKDTAGLLALGSRLALNAAGCLVSSIPKQSHLRAGERMRSVFLLELHFYSFFSLTAAGEARYSPAWRYGISFLYELRPSARRFSDDFWSPLENRAQMCKVFIWYWHLASKVNVLLSFGGAAASRKLV